jgi:threonine aldolase
MCDDPTVIALEQLGAKMFGKAAALYVPSGTMANLIACMVHCDVRGSEMIVGGDSHIHFYEQGGSATLGGIHSRVVANQPDGTLLLADIAACVRKDDVHFPISRLVCLETTQNRFVESLCVGLGTLTYSLG